MKNKVIKVLSLLVLLVVPFLLTGCGSNNTPKNVAVEMVERLSEDNYKNIGKLFYQEENSYFDEEVFKDLVEEKNLNISGNSKIKVKSVGDEITNSDGNSTVKVQIAIDNGKIFNVNTIKVKNKWYVYAPNFYDGNIEIVVPKGSKVKFNDKTLSKSYLKTKETDVTVTYPSTYRKVELEDVNMDVYTIKNVIKGKYSVSVEGDNLNTVKDVVYTYSKSRSSSSSNYDYDKDYSNNKVTYMFKLSMEGSEVKTFVKDYLNNIYKNAVETHSFDGVKKYFDEDSSKYNEIKSGYESLINKVGVKGESTSYLDSFEIENLDYEGIYYYDDNNIAAIFSYKAEYKSNYTNNSFDRSFNLKTILILKKDSKGNFVITNGYQIFGK